MSVMSMYALRDALVADDFEYEGHVYDEVTVRNLKLEWNALVAVKHSGT